MLETQARQRIGDSVAQFWNQNKWVIPLIAALIVSLVDPFGFSSATDQRSHAVFNRIAAPFYTPDGYNRIAIVLIDDDYLAEVGDTYPMSRYNYLDIHASVMSGEPASVFYDLHMPANRAEEDATLLLGGEIAATAGNGRGERASGDPSRPSVWFSDFGGTPDEIARYDLFGQVETLPVRTIGVPIGQYAPCMDADGRAASCLTEGARPSPALEMYRIFCARSEISGCDEIRTGSVMVLQWSRKPEPGRSDCSPDPDTLLGDAALAARITWNGLVQRVGQDPDLVQVCYPFQTIRAVDLARMSETALKEAFKDQLVLVGALFSDAPDTTISPVHGQLPGVFVHATALENLLNFGNGYWRADRGIQGSRLGYKFIMEALTLLAATLVLFFAGRFQRRQMALAAELDPSDLTELVIARRRLRWSLIYLVLQVGVLVGLALAVPLILSMPPTNFYGLVVLTLPLMLAIVASSVSNWFMVSIEKGLVGKVGRHVAGHMLLYSVGGIVIVIGLISLFVLTG